MSAPRSTSSSPSSISSGSSADRRARRRGRVLELSAHDPRAIAVLRRLLSNSATKEQAAQVLAAEYAATGDARQEAEALAALLVEREGRRPSGGTSTSGSARVQDEKLAIARAPRSTSCSGRSANFRRISSSGIGGNPRRAREPSHGSRRGIPRGIARRASTGHRARTVRARGAPARRAARAIRSGASPYLERVLVRDPGNERRSPD